HYDPENAPKSPPGVGDTPLLAAHGLSTVVETEVAAVVLSPEAEVAAVVVEPPAPPAMQESDLEDFGDDDPGDANQGDDDQEDA
ncbi:MAG: hypothetical protein ACI9WU_001676, partial [Myxococcota bacterium]